MYVYIRVLFLDELPERCRVIFLIIREENLKYREVAEIVLITERTVHTQMIIAVKKIITAINLLLGTNWGVKPGSQADLTVQLSGAMLMEAAALLESTNNL